MKKTKLMIMAAALAAGVATAADVSVSGDFASAYIFRGVTLNDGLVFQPGAEISGFPIPEEYGSIAVGTWANFDISDDGGRLNRNEFSEIDYYISYSLPVSIVDLGVAYTEYTYPNSSGTESDKEVAFSAGKGLGETGLYASLTANYGLGGLVEEEWYIQGALDYEKSLTDALTLSAGINAAYAIQKADDAGFNDAGASVGLSYALTENWSVGGSLNYVAQLDDDVLTDAEYDKSFYATLGLACSF
jgi:uncharacterized protein (TIGR02001 family)